MIHFIPNLDSLLWSRKSIQLFDSDEDLRLFVSDQRTRFCHFVGRPDSFCPHDVRLDETAPDPFIRWSNYRSVTIDGVTVGFCGE